VIVLAVRWYLRFGLSDRDVEELLTERPGPGDGFSRLRSALTASRRRWWPIGHGRSSPASKPSGTGASQPLSPNSPEPS